jgi:hypothetical protein
MHPYDTVVTGAMVQGCPVAEHTDGPVTEAARQIWERVKERMFADG